MRFSYAMQNQALPDANAAVETSVCANPPRAREPIRLPISQRGTIAQDQHQPQWPAQQAQLSIANTHESDHGEEGKGCARNDLVSGAAPATARIEPVQRRARGRKELYECKRCERNVAWRS